MVLCDRLIAVMHTSSNNIHPYYGMASLIGYDSLYPRNGPQPTTLLH